MTGLTIRDMSLGYGKTPILSDVSLPPMEGGMLVGILGANGAGKSTFLRGLAGLGQYSGHVALDDVSLSSLSFVQRAAQVAYLPQTLPQPTTLVAYEAVVSACRSVWSHAPKEDVEAAVEDVFDRLHIRHLAFQPLHRMSGGQRQMVGLAQVIVRKPRIMLLDEPTSALDLKWQLNVFDVVRDIVEETGGLCLMALHDLNLAMRHCDRLALFSQGSLLSFGKPEEAVTADVLQQAYGVIGRLETCSQGMPFIVTDGVARQAV